MLILILSLLRHRYHFRLVLLDCGMAQLANGIQQTGEQRYPLQITGKGSQALGIVVELI